MSNEEFVRHAYDVAEVKDIPGWIACFNPDGVFTDNSVGITYHAPDEVATARPELRSGLLQHAP